MNQLVDKNSLAKFMTLLKRDLDGFARVQEETHNLVYGWMQLSGFLPSGGSVAGFFSEGALDTKMDFPIFGSSALPGKKDLLRMWVPVLMDTTKNTNKTTPAKRLRRNNLLRFEDGSFAPVVGITQAMYEQCMNHNIYTLDIESGEYTRIYPLGEYDAVAQWKVDKARIKAGKPFQELFMENEAGGYTPVTHILRPWETTETKYTLGMANITTLYLLDQQKVPSDNLGVGEGRLWKGIFVNADSFLRVLILVNGNSPLQLSACAQSLQSMMVMIKLVTSSISIEVWGVARVALGSFLITPHMRLIVLTLA